MFPSDPARSDATRRDGLSRRGLLAATAAGVPAAFVIAASKPAHADPSVTGGDTRITEHELQAVGAVDEGGAPAREITDVLATMVGVTWVDTLSDPVVEARGRQLDGMWSPWYQLEVAIDPETGDEATATELAWLGEVDAVQVRGMQDGADVTDQLIAHVVTTSPTDEDSSPVTAGAHAAASATPNASNPSTPRLGPQSPSYTSRAGWGANESWARSTSAADHLKAVVIHHTAGSNSYSSATSPQIVRGIYSYHTQTLGWADVGYNILVDKYGRIFEGRGGGLHRNIAGAHARGFNTGSFGISVMGDYSTAAPPWAAREAVAQIIGWKLLTTFKDRVSATESWTPTTSRIRFKPGVQISLQRVFAHRDVNYTDCPGNAFYGQMGAIRNRAQSFIDRGWRVHLDAYNAAGGQRALGTVTHGAHTAGRYTATLLTNGIILTGGGRPTKAWPSPFAKDWKPSWGHPVRTPVKDGSRTIQAFEHGLAALEGGRTRFVTRTFKDVPPERVFFLEIEDLAAKKVTTGWGDRTFRPDNDNLRDAMIVFIYRALGSPRYTAPRNSPFVDVSRDFVFYKELCWAHESGIARGWSDKRFRPLIPVKRDAVAAFLYRAAGEPKTSARGSKMFKDVTSDVVFDKEIGWLAETGISRGWPDGTFRPFVNIKRDQMATFVNRWMRHTGRA